jgi:hypothetical protein
VHLLHGIYSAIRITNRVRSSSQVYTILTKREEESNRKEPKQNADG